MPFEDARSHLGDIPESILHIELFVRGMDFEAYRVDDKTQAAVERKILIISEAAIRLKDQAEALCPGVPWRDIRGVGNWLRHQYDPGRFAAAQSRAGTSSNSAWTRRLRLRAASFAS